jgi:hypothetical protein
VGILAGDLWIPEAVPFLSAYANAHFPVAASALLGGTLVVAGGGGRMGRRALLAVVCGAALGAVAPFSLVSLVPVLAGWTVLEVIKGGGPVRWACMWSSQRNRVLPLLALAGGAAPWLVYDVWISRTYPALAAWTLQNRTPSPPVLETLLGYGLILILALVGWALGKPHRRPEGRLLLSWAVLNGLLLYAPFPLQRRLMLGLFFPLAGLAAVGLQALAERGWRLRTTVALTLILAVPSNIVVVGAGLAGVRAGDQSLVLSAAEVEGYTWLDENVASQSLILAGPTSGNRLPAFADVRVLYGHPFETPNASAERALVERLYAGNWAEGEALQVLAKRGVDYVLYGPHEQQLGDPDWLRELPAVYRGLDVAIYRVVQP